MTEQKLIFRRAVAIGTIISVSVAAFVIHLDLSFDLEQPSEATGRFPLPLPWTIFASLLLGMGLGTQLSLFGSNRHRLRAVFRPSKGRIICGSVLASLAPVAQFWGIPMALAFVVQGVIRQILDGSFEEDFNSTPVIVLAVAYPAFAYVFSCLIVSGIKRKILRIAAFGQIWLAAYGAVVLVFGFYSGNM